MPQTWERQADRLDKALWDRADVGAAAREVRRLRAWLDWINVLGDAGASEWALRGLAGHEAPQREERHPWWLLPLDEEGAP